MRISIRGRWLRSLAALRRQRLPLPAAGRGIREKSVTFVVPFAAGSATDQLARALGQSLTAQTKQPVVVDNRPGASGFIAAQAAARAPADGYTVLITTNTTHAANEHLYKKLPYDPVKDFQPVTLLGKGGQIMVVNPALPAKSVTEFIALAKKEPGKRTFGSGSSSSRIAGELFQQMADVKLVHVPYKSNPMAVTDLLGGQIDMMITDAATGLPQVKGGKLRALGVSSSKRSPLAPDVPTIDEAGVKGYEMGYWFARLRAGRHAGAGGRQAAERVAGQGHAERGSEEVLRDHRHRAGSRRPRRNSRSSRRPRRRSGAGSSRRRASRRSSHAAGAAGSAACGAGLARRKLRLRKRAGSIASCRSGFHYRGLAVYGAAMISAPSTDHSRPRPPRPVSRYSASRRGSGRRSLRSYCACPAVIASVSGTGADHRQVVAQQQPLARARRGATR